MGEKFNMILVSLVLTVLELAWYTTCVPLPEHFFCNEHDSIFLPQLHVQ